MLSKQTCSDFIYNIADYNYFTIFNVFIVKYYLFLEIFTNSCILILYWINNCLYLLIMIRLYNSLSIVL